MHPPRGDGLFSLDALMDMAALAGLEPRIALGKPKALCRQVAKEQAAA